MAAIPFGVIVKFIDAIVFPLQGDIEAFIEDRGIGPWADLETRFPDLELRPAITSISPQRLDELVAEARRLDPSYAPPRFRNYVVVFRDTADEAERLARELRGWPSVERAYVRSGPVPPPCTGPGPNPCRPEQLYLDVRRTGIDAAYAATLPGGKGEGQAFIDVEQGWHLDHEDLLDAGGAPVVTLVWGDNQAHKPHGTSVLGIVLMRDNAIGGIGVVPSLASMRVVSEWNTGAWNRENAYAAAIDRMSFGDVLLLEGVAVGELPVEVDDLPYQKIRLASALGIVVVEPAGNGSQSVDPFFDPARDSGAILVGGSDAVPYHLRWAQSNWGSRVNCFAQAARVVTAGDPAAASQYTKNFPGTSAAAAIVAGAALAVQGLAEAHFGFRLSPAQIREILSDTTINTPSHDPPSDRIGVMPDLQAIATSKLHVTPDVYVRDFVGDVGDPHTQPASASPDIILLPAAATDPDASFGEGSGTEDDDTLGSSAVAGSAQAIHVRVRNRGGADATNVKIDVYWSPPSSLPTPPWNHIGTATIPTVPAGDVLMVSDAITWPAAQVPGPGHYCLVALIGTPADAAPPIAQFVEWDHYKRFVKENNNVAWRNIDVVAATAGASASGAEVAEAPFDAGGAPDRERKMKLEVESRLPATARLYLEGPRVFVARFGEPKALARRPDGVDAARVSLIPNGVHRSEDVRFAASERIPLRIRVELPARRARRDYWVRVRQIDGDEAVGALTVRVVTAARKKWLESKRVEAWLKPKRGRGRSGGGR